MMLRLLNLELKKLFRPGLSITLVLTALTCILTGIAYRSHVIWYKLGAWEIGTGYMGLLFPLLVTVPVCWQLYYERRDHFLVYTLPRISRERYLTVKWMACALSAFLILAVPHLTAALCDVYGVGPEYLRPSPFPGQYNHVWYDLLMDTPLVYSLLLSLWKGLLGVVVMTFGFVLALYSKNLFVILTAPFVYAVLENFGWSILGMPQYRLITAFDPSCLSYEVITGASFVVGPLLLCVMIGIVALYYTKVKHRTVYGT